MKNPTYSLLLNNQLAFSEGFADFFSMLAQEEEYTPAVDVESIANARAVSGDGKYHGLTVESGEPLQESIPPPPAPPTIRESRGHSSGEDEELTVMRVLWDLYDSTKVEDQMSVPPGAPDFGNMDRVTLGFGKLFTLIKDNKIETLDALWKDLEKSATGDGKTILDYGAIFQLNNVSAQPFFIRQGGVITNQVNIDGVPPTFEFQAPAGWPGGNGFAALPQTMNKYQVVILDQNNKLVFASALFPASGNQFRQTWTPSRAVEWPNLRLNVGNLRWYVRASASEGQYSTGPYWSDALDFTMKIGN